MDLLIIYETVEGQTRKIVEFVEQRARSLGHGVRLVNAGGDLESLSFEGIDKVVLAAPVHERRHPKGFEVLVSANLDKLRRDTL